MGEFVDDIRAALVMNPNFCRLRFKKEESSLRKNGFVRREDGVGSHRNTVICSNVKVEDSNGNVCLQMKDLNSNRKVTFKEDPKRQLLRRRASDIDIRETTKTSTRKQNCAKCSPTLQSLRQGIGYGEQTKLAQGNDSYKREAENAEKLMGPCFDYNSVEDMDLDGDSKYASSDTQSKDSSCDVDPQNSELLPDNSNGFFKDRPVEFETSDSSLVQNESEMLSLDDILARYSSVLDDNSLQILQQSVEPPDRKRCRKKKPVKAICFLAFVLVPTLLFYALVFLYFFQPEPFYSLLLKNLKLKDEPQLSPLHTVIEFVKQISLQLYDYTYEKLDALVTNFN